MSCPTPSAGESVKLSSVFKPSIWAVGGPGLIAFEIDRVSYDTATGLYALTVTGTGHVYPQTNVDCSTGKTVVTFTNGATCTTPAP